MLAILDDEFAPITSCAVFVKAPLERIKVYESSKTQTRPAALIDLSGGLREMLPRLEPLTMPVTLRFLWVQTRDPQWSVFFAGDVQGTEPYSQSVIRGYCRNMGVSGVLIASEPHTRRRDDTGRFGFRKFAMHAQNGDAVRVLAAQIGDNDRWVFTDVGELQPFERPEAYKARRIRDRLTSGMIADYCAALDLYPFEEDFYGPSGLLKEHPMAFFQPRLGPKDLVQKSLAQVQAEAGIVPGEATRLPG